MQLTAISSIERTYDHVYLSPHLDDAAISCGGRIAGQAAAGEAVLVVTLFARDAGKRRERLQGALRPLADTQARRREDCAAMARLGADHLWLDFDDALFRRRVALRRYGLLLGARDIEKMLSETVYQRVQAICRKTATTHLYTPLGVGQHVDHQLAFQVGRRIMLDPDRKTEVVFYEDCPYVFVPKLLRYRSRLGGIDLAIEGPEDGGQAAKGAGAGTDGWYRMLVGIPTLQLGGPLLRPFVFFFVSVVDFLVERMLRVPENASGLGRLSPELRDVTAFREAKLDAAAQYDSQMASHLLDREALSKAYRDYSRILGGEPGRFLERYWRPVPR